MSMYMHIWHKFQSLRSGLRIQDMGSRAGAQELGNFDARLPYGGRCLDALERYPQWGGFQVKFVWEKLRNYANGAPRAWRRPQARLCVPRSARYMRVARLLYGGR